LDIDIAKVRYLRIFAQTIQYGVLAFLIFYIVFCLYLAVFQGGEIDYLFVFVLMIPIPSFIYDKIKESRDQSSILEQLNRIFRDDGVRLRDATETEKNIVRSFFDEKGWEMLPLFTCNAPTPNAMLGRIHGTYFLLFTEELFRICNPWEIWVVLAHERGHFANRDIGRMAMERVLFTIVLWVSITVLVKIWWYLVFFHSGFLPVVMSVTYVIVCFLTIVQDQCRNILYLAKEILADNHAAQILGSPMPMLKCLQAISGGKTLYFKDREKALLWIYKRKIPIE
jgi:Zn-dependent protease with chaperone function